MAQDNATATNRGVMPDLMRGERLQIMLTRGEIETLDTWRFSRHMPSRAAAIRELLKRGLAAEGFALAEPGMKSGDYGIGAGPGNGEDSRQSARK